MYDRQTQSLWVQFTGRAVAGVLAGRQLHPYPDADRVLGVWRARHPHGWVLSRDTGYARPLRHEPLPRV
jgi:Protein of unknown function (DUF3179)